MCKVLIVIVMDRYDDDDGPKQGKKADIISPPLANINININLLPLFGCQGRLRA